MGIMGKVPGLADGRLGRGISSKTRQDFCMSGAELFLTAGFTAEEICLKRNEDSKRSCFVREKGTVKWFNGAKGYGFIQLSTGEDVFVHFSAIQEDGYRTLNEGETVEFELLKGPKGFSATNVLRGAAN